MVDVDKCPNCKGEGNVQLGPNFGGACGACNGTGHATGGGHPHHRQLLNTPRRWDKNWKEEVVGEVSKPHPSFKDDEGNPDRNIMFQTVQGEPSFFGNFMAGAGRKMNNPAAEIFRQGESMKIAWRLLKGD
jgi:hypothetical protein